MRRKQRRGGGWIEAVPGYGLPFCTVVVEAESEEDAKTAAAKRRPEEIQWFGEKDHKPSFLVTYAEPLE